MKNILLHFAMFLALIYSINKINAQALNFSITTPTACNTNYSTNIAYSISNSFTATTLFSFSINSACGNYNLGVIGSSFTLGSMYITCTGPYTVFCSAIGSSSNVLATSSATGNIIAPTLTLSPNNGFGCVGTTFTLNLPGSGVSSFTTSGPFGIQTGSIVVFTPTSSSCFTVLSSIGGCTANTTRCYTLTSNPNVTTASSVSICYGGYAALSASGASSYTWSNGSSGNIANVSSTVSATYTVVGSNPGCTTTSSAVAIVTIIPSPVISVAGLSTVCPGVNLSLTASGANTYTWFAGSTYVSFNSTATINNNSCFTVTGASSNGCMSTTNICPSTLPTQSISIASSGNAICSGGSVTLTAIGASNYTWNTNANTSAIVVSPTSSQCYSVASTGTNGCVSTAISCVTVNNVPNITISSPGNVCANSNFTTYLYASGANTYTWSNGYTGSVCPIFNFSTTTCFSVIGSNSGCGTGTAVTCVSVTPSPTIIVLGLTPTCNGSNLTYTATGAPNFTWYASGSGSIIAVNQSVVTLPSSVCFNLFAYNGCPAYSTTYCPNVAFNPTLVISTNAANLCAGTTRTLTVSGANTYTWSTSSNATSIVVNPLSPQCFTVVGTTTNGCIGTAITCQTVAPAPNVIISGSSSACPGSPIVYTASGAQSYLWSNASTTNSTSISTTASACYSVVGYSNNGCSSIATKCFTLMQTPGLSISGNNSICVGSSASFTASGGTTYTWSTGANTNTTSLIPTGNTFVSVSASHFINNCTSTSTLAVQVNTGCAIVWPGDANRDGQVDNTDVFELGLAANSTGAGRSGASNSWTGQYASAWSGTVSTGWNKAHADCNGDGTINANDTVAIGSNYSLTHAFKNTNSTNGIDLYLVPQNSEAYGGLWNVVDIILGDAGNNITQLYGAAFDLDFDQNMLENDSISLNYTPSFLNAGAQNIEFRKTFFTAGKTYAANVRTNNNNVIGFGKIGELRFKLRNDLADNSSFNFGISNGKKTDAVGNMGTLSTSGFMNLTVNNNATGLSAKTKSINQVQFYPNPANGYLILNSTSRIKTTYRLFDLTGRCVLSGEMTGLKTIDISALDAGVYVFDFETNQIHTQQKLIKH